MDSITTIFGKRVRMYRKQKKLSQEKLAELCELHPVYIGQLERGEKNASLETIMRVSNGLGVSPALLFGEIEHKCEETPAKKAYEIIMQLPVEKQEAMLKVLESAKELI